MCIVRGGGRMAYGCSAELGEHDARCLHCGAPVPPGLESRFCCSGCEAVYAFLTREDLSRYYDLRPRDGLPARPDPSRDHKWLEALAATADTGDAKLRRLSLEVQGLHCAACVWLIQRLFSRRQDAHECLVNPTRGRIHLTYGARFDLAAWARDVEAVGYVLGPPGAENRADDNLTLRLGVSLGLASQTMMLSLALYFGLADGALYDLARQLIFAFSATTVFLGGSFFVRAAWASLKRGALHLDLPIALGIVLAFIGSTISYLRGDARGEFFDTLAVFVALMLVGRWLQERMVSTNRQRLLSSNLESLFSRRVVARRTEVVRCDALQPGDTLLLGRGDLLPVNATLQEQASLSLDWINGESAPQPFRAGQQAPAGAFLLSDRAVCATAESDFASSPLRDLLALPSRPQQATSFWDGLGRYYVLGVLALAVGGFALWASDPATALRVTTAVLVVTCPCAFGIAVPLAYELLHVKSARLGLFVRSATSTDRALAVKRVVFDKTGTLTTGRPELVDPSSVGRLSAHERDVLYNLAARSTHPKARAVLDALSEGRLGPDVIAHEQLGCGMQARIDGKLYRLGRPAWASAQHKTDGDLVFAKDGHPIASWVTREALRPDATAEIRALERAGFETWILSGDAKHRVQHIADRLGIAHERALGDCSPEDKADWLRRSGAQHDTLFVGDGINDTLAADAALVSGTPSIERPFMPSRCDFYFVTPGLAPIRHWLLSARRLRTIVLTNLSVALAYNLGAVALAYSGSLEPWLAAILMPLSSVATLTLTMLSMRGHAK